MAEWWEEFGASVPIVGEFFQSNIEQDAARDAARMQVAGEQEAMGEYRTAQQQFAQTMAPWQQGGASAFQQLGNIQDVQAPRGFSYGGSVQQFQDPSAAYQQQQMQRALEQSAAARGGLMSGGQMKALQENASNLAMRDWANSYNRMMEDKNFAYNQYAQDFQMQRAALGDRVNRLQGLAGMGMSAAGSVGQSQLGLGQQLGQSQQNMAAFRAGVPVAQAASVGAHSGAIRDFGMQLIGQKFGVPQKSTP